MSFQCNFFIFLTIFISSMKIFAMNEPYLVHHLALNLIEELVSLNTEVLEVKHDKRLNNVRSMGKLFATQEKLENMQKQRRDTEIAQYNFIMKKLGKFLIIKGQISEKSDSKSFFTDMVNTFYYPKKLSIYEILMKKQKKFYTAECIQGFLLFIADHYEEISAQDLLVEIIRHKDFISYLPKTKTAEMRKFIPLH